MQNQLKHILTPNSSLLTPSLAFLLVGVWMFGSSFYSRRVIAPALERMANETLIHTDEHRPKENTSVSISENQCLMLMRRATWLVFGQGLFASRFNRRSDVPEYVSKRTLAEVAGEFEKALGEEKKTAEMLALIPDPSAAARYGPACVEYVARLAAVRSKGEAPSEGEALAEIMRYVEGHLRSRFVDRYGEPATTLVLTYRGADIGGQLTRENTETLNTRWRELVDKEINDFSQLAEMNGRNGYVFGGFLFLAAGAFLFVSIFARSMIPQSKELRARR